MLLKLYILLFGKLFQVGQDIISLFYADCKGIIHPQLKIILWSNSLCILHK